MSPVLGIVIAVVAVLLLIIGLTKKLMKLAIVGVVVLVLGIAAYFYAQKQGGNWQGKAQKKVSEVKKAIP